MLLIFLVVVISVKHERALEQINNLIEESSFDWWMYSIFWLHNPISKWTAQHESYKLKFKIRRIYKPYVQRSSLFGHLPRVLYLS